MIDVFINQVVSTNKVHPPQKRRISEAVEALRSRQALAAWRDQYRRDCAASSRSDTRDN